MRTLRRTIPAWTLLLVLTLATAFVAAPAAADPVCIEDHCVDGDLTFVKRALEDTIHCLLYWPTPCNPGGPI